ncbi:MAG: hypothetical protein ACRDST_04090 [Pseudonocardiaceae bacterium]
MAGAVALVCVLAGAVLVGARAPSPVHAAASAADPDTNWQLLDVPGAEHDQEAMAAAAQLFLLAPTPPLPRTCPLPDADPCP